MSEIPLLSPEFLERATQSSRGKRWLELLARKARRAKADDPEAAARGELAARLTGVLERLGAVYKTKKLGALAAVEKLQSATNAFYEEALASKAAPDVARLDKLLRDLDAALTDLEKGVGDVAAEPATPLARPVSKPPGEPPLARPSDKLDKRYNLTAEQRAYFREWRKRAAGEPGDLERMRYERNEAVRRNRGNKARTFEEYSRVEAARNPRGNREAGTAEARELRPGVSEFLKRPLTAGDSFPDSRGKRTKFEVTVTLDSGETVTTRPDGVTLEPDGTLSRNPVLQEHKYWRGGGDGEIPDTPQTRAQRKVAREHGGEHVVSISADAPDLDVAPPALPKPRPDPVLGRNTLVVFVDRNTQQVTRVWSSTEQAWIRPK